MLVGTDADVIDPDDFAISFRPSTYLSRLGKKCQMPIEPPVSAIARAWSGLICRPVKGVWPIARDPKRAVCDNSMGFVAILTTCFTMFSVACATSQTKPRL